VRLSKRFDGDLTQSKAAERYPIHDV
jgi:hypothetical protein